MWQWFYSTTQNQVKAYHVTSKANLSQIMQQGLHAQACNVTSDGKERPEAVYMFAAYQDAKDVQLQKFLGVVDAVILEVTIPESYHTQLHEDGLFNVSAVCTDGSFPTALQFRGDIPAKWIRSL